jgi:hypothetical protein
MTKPIMFLTSEVRFLKDAVRNDIIDLKDQSNQPLSQYGEERLAMLRLLWNKLNGALGGEQEAP